MLWRHLNLIFVVEGSVSCISTAPVRDYCSAIGAAKIVCLTMVIVRMRAFYYPVA